MSTELMDANARLAGISAHFVCFDVVLHMWSGRSVLRDAKVSHNEHVLDKEKITRPQARLLPDQWEKRLSALRTRREQLMAQYALPHIAPGLACVMRTKTPKFLAKLQELQQKVAQVRQALQDAWDVDIVQWNQQRWGSSFFDVVQDGKVVLPGIHSQLPTKESLTRRIALSWSSFAINAGADLVEELTQQELHELADATRRMTQERIDAFVSGLLRAPRERLAAAVADIRSSIARGGKITERTFGRLRDAIQLVNEFQAVPGIADITLTATLTQLEQQLETLPRSVSPTGEELRSFALTAGEELTDAFVQVLDQTNSACKDESAVQRQMANMAAAGRRLML